MNDSIDREVAVFTEALRLPAGERSTFLERACGGDSGLRQRVEVLLKGHDRVGDFLEQSPQEAAIESRLEASSHEKTGDRIGRYKLLEQIGEGGCGVVYLAEQEYPVRRRVALKIIKPGMDTKSVIARFEAERQALALMDHPNIAKVFDAGATESGRPYFVMELICGVKITEYCDQHSLTTEERLKLFVQVCQAIQHAHQKGIIHRDIKPSNILVATTVNGAPLPMVIDFGIAKATTNQRLTDKTLFTAFELLIGTPAYMSPEQAALTSVDVDTRTDIYSLGVLLYELLTSSTPFNTSELMAAGFDEVRRVIREREPDRPSNHLHKLARTDLTTVAHHRKSEPLKLIRAIHGDLDWIAIKAMEKDRRRRYETAHGLSLDVLRHLANEPVAARPPSKLYKFQKIVLRHKLVFIGSGVISLLLVWSLILVSAALAKERQSRREADVARREAESEAVRSKQATKFLEDMLQGVGPSAARGRDTTMLHEILDQTAQSIGQDMTNQPAVEAEMRNVMGRLYQQIGNYARAEEMHRAALAIDQKLFGPESQEVAATLNYLGLVLMAEKKFSAAETVDHDALDIRRRLFGKENADTATSLNNLSTAYREEGRLLEADGMAREALGIRQKLFGDENLDVADSRRNLSIILGDEGKWAESETTARQVLAIRRKLLGPEHVWVASALDDVAWAAGARGKLDEAETLRREALAIRRKLLPEEHPDVANSLFLVGDTIRQRGNLNEAYSVLTAAYSIQLKLLGADDLATLCTLRSLGLTLEAEDKWPEAETVYREALADSRKGAGNDDPQTLVALHDLGKALGNEGKWSEAETLNREALALWRQRAGDNDPQTLYAQRDLATTLEAQDKWSEAETLWRQSLAAWRKTLGNDDPQTVYTLDRIGFSLEAEGKWSEAEAVRRESLALWCKRVGATDPEALYALRRLGLTLEAEGKWPEVEDVNREALAAWRKRAGDDDPKTLYTMDRLALALGAEGKLAESEQVYDEASAARRRRGESDPTPPSSELENLASGLIGQRKFGDAEQMLNQVLTPAFINLPSSGGLLALRGDLKARRGEWEGAAADAGRAFELLPGNPRYSVLAAFLAQSHNRPAYEQFCQRLLTMFADTTNSYFADQVAKSCLFLPTSVLDLKLISHLADTAVTNGMGDSGATPYYQDCKALSEYRLGHFAEAIEWAQRPLKVPGIFVHGHTFATLAMAYWQLGDKDEARAMLANGEKLDPNVMPVDVAQDPSNAWLAWLYARIQLDEAAALIRPDPTTEKNLSQSR
jgi:serine/threonine protein kinase/tetratricopeptide (TPR) repeat protein